MAALTFTINTAQFQKEIEKDLEKFVKTADVVIESELQKAVQNAVNLVPTDEGFLKGSIESFKVAPLSYDFVAGAFYAPFIEFGTGKKVKIPAGYDQLARESGQAAKASAGAKGNFDQRIAEWIKRKGIKPANGQTIKGLIYLIKMEILKNGIRAQPFFIPSWEKFKSQVLIKLDKIKV